MKVLHDDDIVQIYLDEEQNILEFAWKKYAVIEELKKRMEMFYQLIKEYNCTKALADVRGVQALAPEFSEWIKTDWFPRVVRAGIKNWANIVDERGVVRTGVAFMDRDEKMKRVKEESGVKVGVFCDLDEAREWLTSL